MHAPIDNSLWHNFLRSNAADDLLMVARNQLLSYSDTPIHLHWLDGVSLLLIRQAYQQQQSLALCYPVPVCNLPMLAAAQLLIHDLVQNRRRELSVLLISTRTEVRQHYLNLRVSTEPIACALPLARIRTDGAAAIIPVPHRKSPDVPGLYHLSRAHLLDAPWPQGIGAVIVDHAGGSFDKETEYIHELADRQGIPTVIHLSTDPFAPFLQELSEADVPIWVWDQDGLATDFGEQIAAKDENGSHPFGVSSRQFRNIAAGIKHQTLDCHHPSLEEVSRRLWEDLGTVQRAFSGRVGTGIRRAIRAAYGTFYTMLQMPVPLKVYEEEARNMWGIRPVSQRIADLEAFTWLRDEAPDLAEVYWPSLILDLKEMLQTLDAGNPKYQTLVQQIREHLAQHKRLAIVCPNQATQRMLELCLRAREGMRLNKAGTPDDEDGISLITYSELVDLAYSDTLLFPGQFSYGRRQLILTAAAPEMRFLAYRDEADRIKQQITAVHRSLAAKSRTEERNRTWKKLSGTDSKLPESMRCPAAVPSIDFTRSEGKKVPRRAVAAARDPDLSLWTPFSTPNYDLVQGKDALSTENEVSLRPPESVVPSQQDGLVPALRLKFIDGFCYAEPASGMNVFLTSTGKIDLRRTDGLRPEDVVIFVEGDQRRKLYDTILERVEHHSAMGATYILVRYWQQAIREAFFRSGMTYNEFLRELKERGSQMETEPGIRCWVEGEVLGPGDAEDIRRVGEIFHDDALTQEWKRIDKGLRKIRQLHRSLARKLNQVIVEAGLKGRHGVASGDCIDSELNLYIDDFRDSVSLHRIVAISDDTTPVPYMFTGRFFTKETELKW